MTAVLPTKITTPTADATKDQEIEFLNSVAGAMQHGTYLATLFTEEFVTWATKSIREDGWLDIMSDMKALRDNMAEQSRHCVESAQFAQAEITRLSGTVDYLQTERAREIDCYEGQIEDLRIDCNDAYRRLQNAEYELEQARKQVAALKIELFNREHPEFA